MSFCSDIKTDLSAFVNESPCCDRAEAYALSQFGHAFSLSSVSLQTENRAVAERYASQIGKVCHVPLTVCSGENGTFLVAATPQQSRKIVTFFGHEQDVTLRLNRANLDCDACTYAYLRGAFLACGTVTNPQVDYHLEFSVPYYNLSRDLMTLLGEAGLSAKCVKRKGSYVVYFKESEQIEDCLTMIGAMNAALELMNVKMVKNIRNNVNRVSNCENANIDKTVAAAVKQREAVCKLRDTIGLDALPVSLREVCRLRLENPDLSLREIGERLDPPISRSGVNHRMQRIIELAKDR